MRLRTHGQQDSLDVLCFVMPLPGSQRPGKQEKFASRKKVLLNVPGGSSDIFFEGGFADAVWFPRDSSAKLAWPMGDFAMSRFSSRASLAASLCVVLSMAGSIGLPGAAIGQASPIKPMPDPALEAARAAFEALPEADRKGIQDALIWAGVYSGMADGTFGRQTFEAIAAYQRQSGQPANGILTSAARALLSAKAQQARTATGFAIVDEPRSGVRIGIPAKVLPKQDVNQNGGTRWQSPDGQVTLDTRTAPPDATLQALYDRNLAIQAQGRVVTYKIIRPDFFVIAGETPIGKFYTRYAGGPQGIRAFSIGYDKTLSPMFDRLVVSIANSFVSFPMAVAPVAATQTPVPSVVTPAPRAPEPASKTGGPRLIGTGLVVGPRQVLTTAPVSTCPNIQVRGFKPQQMTGQ